MNQYRSEIGLDPNLHDDFLRKLGLPQLSLLQTSSWAKVKDNWDSEIMGFYDTQSGDLVASCLILTRALGLGYKMSYIPRGIATDYENADLLRFIFSELKAYGKKRKNLFIKFDPAIQNDLNGKKVIERLEKLGCVWSGETRDVRQTIQFRFDAIIYKKDYDENLLDKRTKQRLRKARNSYPEIVIGGAELLDEFAALMAMTEERKGVNLRDKAYFSKILEAYPDEAKIVLVKTNLKKLHDEADKAIQQLNENIASTNNQKKKERLLSELTKQEKERTELENLRAEYGDLVPTAGNLFVSYGQGSDNLYAGMNHHFQKYHPSYLAWDMAIQYSFEHGALIHDMGGVESGHSGNLYEFKKHFNPEIEEYIGEFDIPVHTISYPLVRFLYQRVKGSRGGRE